MKKRQKWKVGDLFIIPLGDDQTSAVGQVVGQEPEVLNSVICAIFAHRVSKDETNQEVPLSTHDLVSVLFVTRDLLDSGGWRVVGSYEPLPIRAYLDVDALRKNGFVGARVIGSGIVVMLMDAYYGLYPWDGFHNPEFLDGLLVSGARKPHSVVLKGGVLH